MAHPSRPEAIPYSSTSNCSSSNIPTGSSNCSRIQHAKGSDETANNAALIDGENGNRYGVQSSIEKVMANQWRFYFKLASIPNQLSHSSRTIRFFSEKIKGRNFIKFRQSDWIRW
jgi:hypothetical protein